MLENRIQQITCTISRKRRIDAEIKGKQLLRIKCCLFSSIKPQNVLEKESGTFTVEKPHQLSDK